MKQTKFAISLLSAIIWIVAIFFLSEMPAAESNKNSKKIVNKIISDTTETSAQDDTNTSAIKATKKKDADLDTFNLIFRKFAHAGAYLVLSIFVLSLSLQIRNKIDIKFAILTVFCCFLYACTDEYHQLFVDGRTGQFLDVGIDTIGAIIGTAIFYIVYKIFKNKTIEKV